MVGNSPGGRQRLLLVALLGAVVLAGCSQPQPAPSVCYGCTGEANVEGMPDAAAEPTTHLYLGEDGRVRLVARTPIDGVAAADLRANASRRRDLRAAIRTHRAEALENPQQYGRRVVESGDRRALAVPAFAARNLTVGAEGDNLVVAFDAAGVPDEAATAPLGREGVGGAVIVDRFHLRDGEAVHPDNTAALPYVLPPGGLVVHAPPGTRPAVVPEGATVEGDRVRLESLPPDSYLVFAPEGPAGGVAARATLTADVLDWAVPETFGVALLPAAMLGVLLVGLSLERRTGDRRYLYGALGLTLGPFAAIALVGIAGNGAGWVLVVAVVSALGAGLLWYVRSDGPDAEADTRDYAAGGVPSLPAGPGALARLRAGAAAWRRPVAAVAGGTLLLTVGAAALPADGAISGALYYGGAALPVFALGARGWLRGIGADERARDYRRLLALAVFAGVWLAGLGQVLGRSAPQEIGVVLLVLVWGVGATVVGVVGHRLALVAGRRRADPTAG